VLGCDVDWRGKERILAGDAGDVCDRARLPAG
jgi:hypothetical protein